MTARWHLPALAALITVGASLLTPPADASPLGDDAGTGAARAALERLLPDRADRFVLRKEPAAAPGGSFTVSADRGHIVLAGSDDVAILSAFDHYLEKVAHGQLSRMGDNIPRDLPLPQQPIHKSTTYRIRDAYNFTVAGYSYPNWSWEQWERELDLLAISGVNHALVTIGQEAVWYDTWQQFGYSASEAAAWISPPAHQPWQFMSNLHSFAGGMTAGLIERRAELGRRIIDRMRELGITPVLPGFSGSVPDGFAERNPGAHVIPQGEWYGFMRPGWLDTSSDTYADVAAVFYDSQRRRFGQVRDQAIDLLHEGGQSGGVDLRAAARGITAALAEHDPDYVWVIQAWGGNPRQDVIGDVPPEHVLVQDLTGGRWQGSNAFWGAPWVWGILPNFGGRTGFYGNLPNIATTVPSLPARTGTGRLVGTTIMSEGVDTNPAVWQLMTQAVWESAPIDIDRWLAEFVTARYGVLDPDALKAWQAIYAAAYDSASGSPGGADSLFNAKPGLTATRASANAPGSLPYHPDELAPALPRLLRAAQRLGHLETFRYDLVDVARQVTVNQARVLLPRIKSAYDAKDLAGFEQLTARWLRLMDHEEDLLGTHADFMLGPWLAEARSWGRTDGERATLEYDARSLLTLWGSCWSRGPINNDYANRDWAGLVGGYYKPRWQHYFAGLAEQLRTGTPAPVVDHCEAGDAWSRQRDTFAVRPSGDPVEAAAAVAGAVFGGPLASLSATPDRVVAGEPFEVRFDLQNTGPGVLRDIDAALAAPDGWSVAPIGSSGAITGYGDGTARWSVTPPGDAEPAVNRALGKPATQSSEYNNGQFPARLAVDGVLTNFAHTAQDGSRDPWWQVDLGESGPVAEVRVWNRDSCCQSRVGDFFLFVSDQPFRSASPEETRADPAVRTVFVPGTAGRPSAIPVGGNARYVRIQTTQDQPLNIAEVEVLDRSYRVSATVRYRDDSGEHSIERVTPIAVR